MKKIFRMGIFTLTIIFTMLLILPAARAVDFKISGQVDRAVLWGDNGNDSDTKFVDNDNSSTRFRFTGSNNFDEVWTAGIVWEVEMQSNPSNNTAIDIGQNGDSANVTFDERKIEFYIAHKNWGKIWLGQGSTATDYTSEVDLSGTSVVTYSRIVALNGGFSFRDDDDNIILDSAGNATYINNVFNNYDGLARRDRIRYDTPTLAGFYASTSYMNGQTWDVALRSAHEWDGFGKLAGALGYVPGDDQRDPYKQFSGSLSFLHNSGLNLTVSHAYRDFDGGGRNTSRNYYAKLGYQVGKWAFSVDGTRSNNVDQNGDEGTSFCGAAVWNVWKSIELYSAYRWDKLDRDNQNPANTSDPENISSVMIGGRVKF
jgi:predicted porin